MPLTNDIIDRVLETLDLNLGEGAPTLLHVRDVTVMCNILIMGILRDQLDYFVMVKDRSTHVVMLGYLSDVVHP